MAPQEALAVRPPKRHALVAVEGGNGHKRSANGWHWELFDEHLTDHTNFVASRQWCSPSCMARTIWGRESKLNNKRVRHKIRDQFRRLLATEVFLIVEYNGPKGQISAFKFYDDQCGEVEQQAAEHQLSLAIKRREIATHLVERAQGIIHARTLTPGDLTGIA